MVCLLLSGVTVCAVGAVSLYRQRMEEMTPEEAQSWYELAEMQETGGMSRLYTAEEQARYEELSSRYEKDGLFPEKPITQIGTAMEYTGEGVALETDTALLYLPEGTLSDEDLLEIIDYHHKMAYSIREVNEAKILSDDGWEKRMAEMSDEEVDRIYAITCSTLNPTGGGYSRSLTETESARYEELVRQYEDEGVWAEGEPVVIQMPEEYTGDTVAICVEDANYYLTDRELTDGELLWLIDMEHKTDYCLDRILRDVQMGLRERYPTRIGFTPEEEDRLWQMREQVEE
ncbi:MAG: hypothetical protein NC398_04855 [Acetatifactor muris]|nr:hypothetical protein [Acetatifactor muris]